MDQLRAAVPAEVREAQQILERKALVLEHSRRRQAPEELGALKHVWSRRYGDTQVSIYREEGTP